MESWHWGLLLRPFLALILFGIVITPLGWLFGRLIPEGRLKRFLTKDRTRPTAPLRDRIIYGVVVILALTAAVLYVGVSMDQSFTVAK